MAEDRRWSVFVLIGKWTCIWVAAHHLLWPLWKCKGARIKVLFSPTPVDIYRRRLCRGQVYNFIAGIGGVYLFSRCQRFPHDLIYDFSPEHQLLFSMAVGHWLVSIWEDSISWQYLKSGLRDKDLQLPTDPAAFLRQAYLIHHIVAAGGYTAILLLQTCTAVGGFGLIYEIPVLLLNHREFLILAEPQPQWFLDVAQIDYFWGNTTLAFVIVRGIPTAVYIYSLFNWMEDLNKMGPWEQVVYHSMALFFSFLNYSYLTFLLGWRSRDVDIATASSDPTTDKSDEEDGIVYDPDIKQACPVLVDDVRSKDGSESANGELWVEVDSIAYNVTKYMKLHPGGEEVFRRAAGQDASEVFRAARHSVSAKIQMQRYMIGPIWRQNAKYRIFEQHERINVFYEAVNAMMFFCASVFYIARSPFSSVLDAEAPVLAALVPGILLAIICGSFVFVARILSGRPVGCGGNFCGSCTIGVCLLLFYVGLVLARHPLPAGCADCPTGIELGAGLLFLIEDLIEFRGPAFLWSATKPLAPQVAGGLAAVSWILRGALAMPAAAPTHLLSACLIAVSLAMLVRIFDDGNGSRNRQEFLLEAFGGMILAAVFGALALLALASNSPVASEAIAKFWQLPRLSCVGMFVVALSNNFSVMLLMNSAYSFSAAWCSRLTAVAFGLSFAFWGLGGWRWLAALGLTCHFYVIGDRNRQQLHNAQASGMMLRMPFYMIGTQGVWDQIRTGLCTVTWKIVVKLTSWLVRMVLPKEFTLYALDIPIFHLGNKADLGVAMSHMRSPQADSLKPDFWVVNVGHVSESADGWLDLQRRMSRQRSVWKELARPEVKGLCQNVACIFPNLEGAGCAKELHMTAWSSPEEAHDFHDRSLAFKALSQEQNGSRLKTMSNLSGYLRPTAEIRHQDRCKSCSRVVESMDFGAKAPHRCPYCGESTFHYPFI